MIPASTAALAVSALALASATATAQPSSLPKTDSAPAGRVARSVQLEAGGVGGVVERSLPPAAEEVVGGSPAAPTRKELLRLVGGGAGGGDSGSGGSGAASSRSGGMAGPHSESTSSSDSPAVRGGERGGPVAGASPAATPGGEASSVARGGDPTPPTAARRARRDASREVPHNAGSDKIAGAGNVTRTIREAVRVVPAAVWAALAALLAVALVLGARAFVDRRRTNALEREKDELLRDVELLERALLPAVPERLGALCASVAFRPAAGPAAGGDFFDAFEPSAGRAAILIGDVSGHGRDALVRTRSMRSTLRACLEAGMSPRAALESAARELAGVSSGDFATVAVAVHDAASGMLTYATAGHPPPILVGAPAHEPITVASAVPIGLGVRTGQRQTTVPLPAGSAACFFTDGLLEARKSGELIGRSRLTRIVTELGPDEHAEALVDRVVAAADETHDDMAVCLVRALDGSEVRALRLEELELDGEELGRGIAERFLEVCDVPPPAIASALDDARRTAAVAGGAVLEVTIDSAGGSVSVKAPGSEAEPARPPVALAELP